MLVVAHAYGRVRLACVALFAMRALWDNKAKIAPILCFLVVLAAIAVKTAPTLFGRRVPDAERDVRVVRIIEGVA